MLDGQGLMNQRLVPDRYNRQKLMLKIMRYSFDPVSQ